VAKIAADRKDPNHHRHGKPCQAAKGSSSNHVRRRSERSSPGGSAFCPAEDVGRISSIISISRNFSWDRRVVDKASLFALRAWNRHEFRGEVRLRRRAQLGHPSPVQGSCGSHHGCSRNVLAVALLRGVHRAIAKDGARHATHFPVPPYTLGRRPHAPRGVFGIRGLLTFLLCCSSEASSGIMMLLWERRPRRLQR
jgi:hypothetical protein